MFSIDQINRNVLDQINCSILPYYHIITLQKQERIYELAESIIEREKRFKDDNSKTFMIQTWELEELKKWPSYEKGFDERNRQN